MKKRILIATGVFAPDIGGPATYSKLLADELPRHGIDVSVLSFRSVRHLPKAIRHIAYCVKAVRASVRAGIVFAQDPVSVGLPALCAAKIMRKRFVLKVVGDYAWEQYCQQDSGKKKFLTMEEFQHTRCDRVTEVRRKIQRFVAQHADIIIVPSYYLKTIIMQWGVLHGKIHVIYNACEASHVVESKEEARKMLGVSGTVMVSIGRLVPWKGFSGLIDSIPTILAETPDLVLVIVGDGPQKSELEKHAQELEVDDHVIFTGRAKKEDVWKYLRAANVFALNTAYEGFSHQILEAMDIGVPIVTTAVGGNGEVIKNGEDGVLVAYNDIEAFTRALQRIFQDPVFANTLAQNAKEKAEMFSIERMIQETITALQI
ncbi:MAG: glycosyltransferase family 4 protein [Candidatus Azambacteria bacterium]|nr:glycosyltransferase family 4 protein [Candidatus Azambacteria bacterium]